MENKDNDYNSVASTTTNLQLESSILSSSHPSKELKKEYSSQNVLQLPMGSVSSITHSQSITPSVGSKFIARGISNTHLSEDVSYMSNNSMVLKEMDEGTIRLENNPSKSEDISFTAQSTQLYNNNQCDAVIR